MWIKEMDGLAHLKTKNRKLILVQESDKLCILSKKWRGKTYD